MSDSLIGYTLNKHVTFSIQSLNINQNPKHIKIKQLVIKNLHMTDSAEIFRRNDIDEIFGQTIPKYHHISYS